MVGEFRQSYILRPKLLRPLSSSLPTFVEFLLDDRQVRSKQCVGPAGAVHVNLLYIVKATSETPVLCKESREEQVVRINMYHAS